jgi:hypothetical protein
LVCVSLILVRYFQTGTRVSSAGSAGSLWVSAQHGGAGAWPRLGAGSAAESRTAAKAAMGRPGRGDMPASNLLRRCGIVPEGHLAIARRFNVGSSREEGPSPEGTADGAGSRLSRPSGTRHPRDRPPTLKRWAIIRCPSGTNAKSPSELGAALTGRLRRRMKAGLRAGLPGHDSQSVGNAEIGPQIVGRKWLMHTAGLRAFVLPPSEPGAKPRLGVACL